MDRQLSIGLTGSDVGQLQNLLNRRPPTQLSALKSDNIFGLKTSARVKEFQRNNGLQADGVVGPKTRAKLQASQPQPPQRRRSGTLCGNSDVVNQSNSASVSNAFVSSFAGQNVQTQSAFFGSSSFRSLTPAQIAAATAVFGSSLNFSRIFISDKTGLGGLPFTVGVPATVLTPAMQIMNCGTFSPPNETLIHELAHVWQSQHHQNTTEFMKNAVGSQGAALALNGAEGRLDSSLRTNADFPLHFPFSAYALVPGKPFGEYAAEQIANGVEHNVSSIVAHVKSVGMDVVDSNNQVSLKTVRIGDQRLPGVVF